MNKLLATAASITLLGSATAEAADLAARTYTKAPPAAVTAMDWSGFYIGLNGGGGSSHKCWSLTNNAGTVINPPIAEGCHDATGGTIGGQIGYRWQTASWVFGLEAQGNWANFSGSNGNIFQIGITDRSRIDALGLFTGQVGYARGNALLYLKGGAAVVRDRYDTYGTIGGIGIDQGSETRWGGVIGAGVEFAFAPQWSVGLEYDHLFMGTKDVNFYTSTAFFVPVGTFSATNRISQDADIGVVRVNYRFGGPVVAKY